MLHFTVTHEVSIGIGTTKAQMLTHKNDIANRVDKSTAASKQDRETNNSR
jgi:hypothetical protein